MTDKGRNGRKHSDPHRNLHAGSGGAPGDRTKSRSGPPSGSDATMNASSASPPRREPSMGGSQGTRGEARAYDATALDKASRSSREGGYGADSGYSDGSRNAKDAGRSARGSTEDRDSSRRHEASGSSSDHDSQRSRPEQPGKSDSKSGRS